MNPETRTADPVAQAWFDAIAKAPSVEVVTALTLAFLRTERGQS